MLKKIKEAAQRRNEIEAARPENPTLEERREWGKTDLWYLCRHVLGWYFYDDYTDSEGNFHSGDYAKYFCEEVQRDPDRLFLVARGHLKSLTITCAKSIQELICDPEKSIAIMSYNEKTARAFLRQIKHILETNDGLKSLYPDIFWEKPKSQASMWNELSGLNVRRKTTRKEPSVYSFGLVDSQLTGMHSDILVYDDVIIQDSVTSPYMINKTTRAWELSANLGMMESPTKKRYCGTRYHYADTYGVMIERGIKHVVIAATDDGTMSGNPIYMSMSTLEGMIRDQGSYTFTCQMLLKPVADGEAKFNIEDIQYYDSAEEVPVLLNKYILVDPANTTKASSDFTAMLVMGYDAGGDVWLVDGIHDKINLGRRWNCLQDLHELHKVTMVGYESYGLQADVDYFNMEIMRTRCRFPAIRRVSGVDSKSDRILRLVPIVEQRRLHVPRTLIKKSYKTGEEYDITGIIVSQFEDFPFGKHDDAIDCVSRIYDVVPVLPRGAPKEEDISGGWFGDEPQNKAKLYPSFLRRVGDKLRGVGK